MSKEDDKLKGYQVVNTKISLVAYYRLIELLKRKGLNFYKMIQNFCDCLIRNMDDKHNLTPETEKVMDTFEHMVGWENNFNLADPKSKPEISEATYYLCDERGKKGIRVIHVERPFFGDWKQTLNVHQIMERFMCLTFPQLYKRLRFIAVCRQCASVLELMNELVRELEEEERKKELLAEFEDYDRGDFGQKPSDVRYRRKLHLTPDMFETHKSAKEEDTEEARQWMDENMEGKPHGYEW